jgi:protein-S-isoprenylcysteine O-methyltransferase Ste14
MPIFFKPSRGQTRWRLTLFASIAIGLVATLGALWARTSIGAWATMIGGTLGIGAQVLFWTAVRAHGRQRPSGAFASLAPSGLITHGPYRWVRHPFYTAYVLAFLAGAAFAQSGWLWLVPAWMVTIYALAAHREELLILSSPLGRSYVEYQRSTGAFFPRWTALQSRRPR